MPKRRVAEVQGVRAEGDRFCVRWATADGKGHAFSRKDRALVEARRSELIAEQAEDHGAEGDAFEVPSTDFGTLRGWQEAAAWCARESLAAVQARDEQRARALKRYSGVLRELSAAWAASAQYEQLETALEESTAWILDVHKQSVDAAERDTLPGHVRSRAYSPEPMPLSDPSLGRGAGPVDPVCRPAPGPDSPLLSPQKTLKGRPGPGETN